MKTTRRIFCGLVVAALGLVTPRVRASDPEDYKLTHSQVHATAHCGILEIPGGKEFARLSFIDIKYAQPYQGKEKLPGAKVACLIGRLTMPGSATCQHPAKSQGASGKLVIVTTGGTYTFTRPKIISLRQNLWTDKHGSFSDINFTAENVEFIPNGR